jgi:hypothetical protein
MALLILVVGGMVVFFATIMFSTEERTDKNKNGKLVRPSLP